MARPRIFVSSTYYDLRHVRADLERFITDLGYDAVLNEQGSIPYGHEDRLEEYCYREIEFCDILVSIIGGRYGSPSDHTPHSISQMELKAALDLGRPVYIFVDRNVLAEYATYRENKDNKNVRYRFVDDVRVYQFLEQIESLPKNNPICSFETSNDIKRYLKEQWSGLFQRFLQEQSRLVEINVLDDMKSTAKTLNQLVEFLTDERKKGDRAVKEILMSNHPAFQQLGKLLSIPYRVYFTSRKELLALIKVRSFVEVPQKSWDEPAVEEFLKERKDNAIDLLMVATEIFDKRGNLKIMTADQWDANFITLERRANGPEDLDLGDDIPF